MSLRRQDREYAPVRQPERITLTETTLDYAGPGTYDEKYIKSATPVTIPELILERGPEEPSENPVLGHIQLAPTVEQIQHFGSCDIATAISKQRHPEDLHSGRIAILTATTKKPIPGGGEKTKLETLTCLHVDDAKGEILRLMEAEIARQNGTYSPMEKMRSAFALLAYQEERQDWVLVDTITDVDPCPENALIIQLVQTLDAQKKPKTMENGDPVLTYRPVMLSTAAAEYDAMRREKYRSNEDYEAVMHGVIKAMHEMYVTGNERYDFEKVEHHPNPVLNRDIKIAIQIYKQYSENGFSLRIPAMKAYNELNEITAIEKQKPDLPAAERNKLRARRSAVYTEVAQAIAMVKVERDIKQMAARASQMANGEKVIDWIRWRIKVLNKSDIEFALNLPEISGPNCVDNADEIADYYESYQNAHLLVTATEDNELRYGLSLKDDSSSTGTVIPVDNRMTMPYGQFIETDEGDILDGDFLREKIRSIYDDKTLRFGGMVCKLEAVADDLTEHAMPVLAINLLEAPAKILRHIIDNGHFENAQPGSAYMPGLREIMTKKNPDPKFVIADVGDPNKPILKEKKYLREGDAAQFVVNAVKRNIREVRIQRSKVVSELEITAKNRNNHKKPRISKEQQKELADAYRVEPILDMPEDQVVIAGITICRGTVHARQYPAASKLGAQLEVMRSRPRPSQPQRNGRK